MTERKSGSIKAYTYIEEESRLPDLTSFTPQTIPFPDIFLTALGFEKRAIEMPKVLSTIFGGGTRRDAISIIGEYQTNTADNENNRKPLADCLSKFSEKSLRINADNPGELAASLSSVIIERFIYKQSKVRVVFDISGASGNFILSALQVLITMANKVHLIIVYAEAGQYFPPHETDSSNYEKNLSSACEIGDPSSYLEFGVRNPERNELYPGFFHDSRPEYIIAVPSFRANRMLRCLQSIGDQILAAPKENIYWIFGMPPSNSNAWREQFQKDMVLRMLRIVSGSDGGSPDSSFITASNSATCSTLNYKEVTGKLISIADSRVGCRLSLIHMGSKMQSVGLALAMAVRDEISVTFARPDSFNPTLYSDEVGNCWQINFENLEEIVGALGKIGTLKYIPASGKIGENRPSI